MARPVGASIQLVRKSCWEQRWNQLVLAGNEPTRNNMVPRNHPKYVSQHSAGNWPTLSICHHVFENMNMLSLQTHVNPMDKVGGWNFQPDRLKCSTWLPFTLKGKRLKNSTSQVEMFNLVAFYFKGKRLKNSTSQVEIFNLSGSRWADPKTGAK